MRKLLVGFSFVVLAIFSASCNGKQGEHVSVLDEGKEPGIPKKSSSTYKPPLNEVITEFYTAISRFPDEVDGMTPQDLKYINEVRSELCLVMQDYGLELFNKRIVIVERINKSNVYRFGYSAAILSQTSPIHYLKLADYRKSALTAGSRLIDDPSVVVKTDIELFYKIMQTANIEEYNINKPSVTHKESVNTRIYVHIIEAIGLTFNTTTYRLK